MEQNQYTQNQTKYNSFAIASLACGISSLILCCIGLSIPLGAFGILFAVFTYRKGQSLNSMSMAGAITGGIGLFLGLIMGIYILMNPITEDPAFQQGFYDSLEEMYGEDFAKEMIEIYGFELE